MEFWVAVLLFLLAVAGIVLSAVCLRRKKVLRVVCIVICSLLAAALAAYIGLTLVLVDAVQNQPPRRPDPLGEI